MRAEAKGFSGFVMEEEKKKKKECASCGKTEIEIQLERLELDSLRFILSQIQIQQHLQKVVQFYFFFPKRRVVCVCVVFLVCKNQIK